VTYSKFRKFKKADGRRLENVKSSHLNEKSSNFDEIWCTTTNLELGYSHVTKICEIFKLVGGRDIQNQWQYFNGDPLTGVECKGYEKNHDFRAISRFISQMMPDRDIVTVEGE